MKTRPRPRRNAAAPPVDAPEAKRARASRPGRKSAKSKVDETVEGGQAVRGSGTQVSGGAGGSDLDRGILASGGVYEGGHASDEVVGATGADSEAAAGVEHQRPSGTAVTRGRTKRGVSVVGSPAKEKTAGVSLRLPLRPDHSKEHSPPPKSLYQRLRERGTSAESSDSGTPSSTPPPAERVDSAADDVVEPSTPRPDGKTEQFWTSDGSRTYGDCVLGLMDCKMVRGAAKFCQNKADVPHERRKAMHATAHCCEECYAPTHGLCGVLSNTANAQAMPEELQDPPPVLCSRKCAKSFLIKFARKRESPGMEENLASVAEGLIWDVSGFNLATVDNFDDGNDDEDDEDAVIEVEDVELPANASYSAVDGKGRVINNNDPSIVTTTPEASSSKRRATGVTGSPVDSFISVGGAIKWKKVEEVEVLILAEAENNKVWDTKKRTIPEIFEKVSDDVKGRLLNYDATDNLLSRVGEVSRRESGAYKAIAEKLNGSICRVRFANLKKKTASIFSVEVRTGAGDFSSVLAAKQSLLTSLKVGEDAFNKLSNADKARESEKHEAGEAISAKALSVTQTGAAAVPALKRRLALGGKEKPGTIVAVPTDKANDKKDGGVDGNRFLSVTDPASAVAQQEPAAAAADGEIAPAPAPKKKKAGQGVAAKQASIKAQHASVKESIAKSRDEEEMGKEVDLKEAITESLAPFASTLSTVADSFVAMAQASTATDGGAASSQAVQQQVTEQSQRIANLETSMEGVRADGKETLNLLQQLIASNIKGSKS